MTDDDFYSAKQIYKRLEAVEVKKRLAAQVIQHPRAQKPAMTRFTFETVADLRSLPTEQYLIEGWLPERSIGLLYGKWASGKTFLGFDWGLHLAHGLPDWHGAKLPGEPCDVLVIAREGAAGFVKRVSAFQAHHGLEADTAKLVFMRQPISFLDNSGFAALKESIKGLERQFRFVLVDTVARVTPGADIAKEQHVTLFMERLQQVGEITGATSLGVHHENKSGDATGSMMFQNNSDFMFCTERDGKDGALIRSKITCAKMKDGNDLWFSDATFIKVELPDGESSLVVESVSGQRNGTAKSGKITARQRLALDALDEAVLSHGKPPPASFNMSGITAVEADLWRKELFSRGVLDKEAKNPRADFKRIRDGLAAASLIAQRDELIWRTRT